MTKKTSLKILKSNLKDYQWNSKYFWDKNEDISLYVFEETQIRNYLDRFFQLNGLLIHSCKINRSKYKLEIVIAYLTTLKSIKQINKDLSTVVSLKEKNNGKLEKFAVKLLENFYIFTNKNVKINVVFQNINRGLSVRAFTLYESQIFKRILLQLRKYKNNRQNLNLREFLNILRIILKTKSSAKLLADFIAIQIRYMRRHTILLTFLRRSLTLLLKSELSSVNGVKIIIKGRFNGKLRAKKQLISIGSIPIQTLRASIDYSDSTAYTPYGSFGVKIWISENV